MTDVDDPKRLVSVVVCGLLLVAGGGPAVGPAGAVPPSSPTAVPTEGAAQLSEALFREPSDTVGEPELAVALADPVVEPGTETTVELTIVNTGQIEAGASLDEATATARGLTVTVDDDEAPVEVADGTAAVGSLPPGESVTVPLAVTAPASADGDEGELDVEIEYTYTEIDDDNTADDETDTDEFDVDIEVGERSRFAIEDAETDAQVGTDGLVDVELENVGEGDAENVRVTARSPTGGVTIGAGSGGGTATGVDTPPQRGDNGGRNASLSERADMSTESAAFLGDLDEGDDETVSFDSRIDSEVSVESYLLEVTVVYEDEDGILRESATLAAAVEPTGAQTFALSDVDSSLAVGESGTITATLENTGPEAVETPVVSAEPASDRIDIGEGQIAVEDLDEDESANISFEADVSGEADPGPRPVTFTVEYGVDDERLDSDPFVRRVAVADDEPAFTITAVDAAVPAGTTQTVQFNVTNNRAEALSNINVFLYPDGPLDVDADEAFLSDLEPGESETISVDVSVDEGTEPRTYPLEADVRYDSETDDDLISQVYQVPIDVTEPPDDDGLLPSLVSLVGIMVIAGGIAVVVRRQQ
ncbi:COG1361 S-layer family protein [Halohasta salina]|uniref:COG1361 S-layer family protein n=1 Tax=Halohasta salina TaxID=2961621 RepID=UPI0020A47BFC|nr:NEW3 domain-containing protein [Halohasta salina]